MKIREIRLRWFRGAAEDSVLRLEGQSIAVYGPNASGKSSFTDSLEYILGGGRIEHLRHQYSGYYQQDAVRNTRTPEGQMARVEVILEEDQKLQADIPPDGPHTLTADPADILEIIGDWRPREAILRQDGLVQFIVQDKGERYRALVPLFGLATLEDAAINAHRLTEEVRSRSSLPASRQRAHKLLEAAERAFGSAANQQVLDQLGEVWSRNSPDEKPTELHSMVQRLNGAISARIAGASPELRLHVQLEGLQSENLHSKLSEARDTRARANTLVDDLLDAKLPILQGAEAFLGALPPEQTEIGCPACGRTVEVDAFREHIQGELSTLKDAREARSAAETARTSFVNALRNAQTKLGDELVAGWAATTETKEAFETVSSIDVQTFSVGTDLGSLDKLQPVAKAAEECIAEKVKEPPPDMGQLSADRDSAAAAADLLRGRALEAYCERVEYVVSGVEAFEAALRDSIRQRTQEVIDDISGDVQALWSILHPAAPISDVRLCIPPDSDKAIDIALTFYG